MRVLLYWMIGGTALYSISMTSSASTSGSISSGSTLTSGAVPIDTDGGCNLNEPWLCSEYMYYECHTCTLNNVCIFNEFAFVESGEFHNKMTHHCQNLPFDCNYFHEIKQCRSRYCATQTLCNLDVDGYEICLIKALLCYDEYCEPDLSTLPFDYRLYDLCCHINDIEDDVGRFQNWLIMVLGVVAMIILLSLYEIYTAFTKHSLQKLCHSLYKKVKYFIKYIIKNYISITIIAHKISKKWKKMKRNIKYHYKNNKMMWCFFNLFDDYFIKINIWNQKQKNGDIVITDDANKMQINNNHHHNNDKTKKSKASNKKKRKKKKKTKTKYRLKPIIKEEDVTDSIQSEDDIDDPSDNDTLSQPEMEGKQNDTSIQMMCCPVCGAMNAQYLSNCDQCNSCMTPKTKKKKKKKKKKRAKDKSMDYWQCLQCTYHNQIKFKKCQMCHINKEDSKFSTKSTKKSKKKRTERHKAHHKASHHNNVNQIYLNQSRKQIVPQRYSPKKTRNTLNPNAKEFIFDSKSVSTSINSHPVCNSYYSSYPCHSPSRRLSKIPRLQKSVNPEPDYAPRHTRNSAYCGESNGYHEPSNHSMPPRFHSPPFHHHSNPMSSGSEDRGDFEMASSSISDQTLMDSSSIYPGSGNINIPMITPMLPVSSAPSLGTLPIDIDNADLQRQLSSMEANVHKQLQVLDTLFPGMKPDLSQEIKTMQENMKVEI